MFLARKLVESAESTAIAALRIDGSNVAAGKVLKEVEFARRSSMPKAVPSQATDKNRAELALLIAQLEAAVKARTGSESNQAFYKRVVPLAEKITDVTAKVHGEVSVEHLKAMKDRLYCGRFCAGQQPSGLQPDAGDLSRARRPRREAGAGTKRGRHCPGATQSGTRRRRRLGPRGSFKELGFPDPANPDARRINAEIQTRRDKGDTKWQVLARWGSGPRRAPAREGERHLCRGGGARIAVLVLDDVPFADQEQLVAKLHQIFVTAQAGSSRARQDKLRDLASVRLKQGKFAEAEATIRMLSAIKPRQSASGPVAAVLDTCDLASARVGQKKYHDAWNALAATDLKHDTGRDPPGRAVDD